MDLLDTYLDLARQREKDLAREASEVRDRRRTRESRSTHSEKGASPLEKSLRRTALCLTKLMGRFPY
jgi:hypothetical protein